MTYWVPVPVPVFVNFLCTDTVPAHLTGISKVKVLWRKNRIKQLIHTYKEDKVEDAEQILGNGGPAVLHHFGLIVFTLVNHATSINQSHPPPAGTTHTHTSQTGCHSSWFLSQENHGIIIIIGIIIMRLLALYTPPFCGGLVWGRRIIWKN